MTVRLIIGISATGVQAVRLGLQILLVILLAIGLSGVWSWYQDSQPSLAKTQARNSKRNAATPVVVMQLSVVTNKSTIRAIGTGKAYRSVVIYPAVQGEVVEVSFQAEQKVKKGALLLRLDDKHQILAIKLANVALRQARRQLRRLKKLAKTGNVAPTRLDSAQADFESARLRLAQAKIELSDRLILAPFTGIVGLSDIDVGDRVTETTAITTLDDRSKIYVEFAVPEDFAAKLRPGYPITVKLWSHPDREFSGKTTALGSRINEATRSLIVRAEIPNPDDFIRPGSSFQVRLDFVGKRFPKVQEVAVSWSRDGAYVWQVKAGRAVKKFVKLVRREKGYLLIDGDLRAGDQIVIEGLQGLRPNQPVTATRADNGATESPVKEKGVKTIGTKSKAGSDK